MIELDNNIIQLCLKKDKKAQMRLYELFFKRIYNSCFRLLKNQYEAEDAMQESFIKAFSKLEQYDYSVSFEIWLVRIAINTSIDKLRAKENNVDWVDINENTMFSSENDNIESEEISEKAEQVKQVIFELGGINRIMLSLYLIEGYDHEEIADILNLKAATVRVKYMRAKQELIKKLNEKRIQCKI